MTKLNKATKQQIDTFCYNVALGHVCRDNQGDWQEARRALTYFLLTLCWPDKDAYPKTTKRTDAITEYGLKRLAAEWDEMLALRWASASAYLETGERMESGGPLPDTFLHWQYINRY